MTTDNINMLMRSLFINISSFIIFFIITNYKSFDKIQKTKIVLSIILLVFAEVLLKNKTNFVTTIISIILIETILLKSITKIKISKVIISVIISLAVSNLIFIVSGTIEFFVQSLFRINNKIINFLITFVIHFIIIFLITKIKRIKNGLSFLKKENEFIEIAIINISAILIIAYILIGYKYEPLVQNVYFCYIVLGLFLILIVQKTNSNVL